MSSIDKKSPFKVPDGYFNHFDQKLTQKIDTINPNNGYRTPINYFQEVEDQILNRIDYPEPKTPPFLAMFGKLWPVWSV